MLLACQNHFFTDRALQFFLEEYCCNRPCSYQESHFPPKFECSLRGSCTWSMKAWRGMHHTTT